MPIPTSRAELVDSIRTGRGRLCRELDTAGPRLGSNPCIDDWSVKCLPAVRVWWTTSVMDWIEAGKRGEKPATLAVGYRWSETPRLNSHIVRRGRRESYKTMRARLENGAERALSVIDSMTDDELPKTGVFALASKYPLAIRLSMNTTRQYTTARTCVKRAMEAGTSPDQSPIARFLAGPLSAQDIFLTRKYSRYSARSKNSLCKHIAAREFHESMTDPG